MNDLSKVKDYIDLLKKEHNLSVSFHIDESDMSAERIAALIEPLRTSLGLDVLPENINDSETNLVARVKKYIRSNRSKNITSEDICRHLGCSRSLISHQFKEQTGMSLREYITVLRLADSKILLQNSDLTVTEVAFAVGFSSSNYFANVFKRETGMSPGDYRKQNQEKQHIKNCSS